MITVNIEYKDDYFVPEKAFQCPHCKGVIHFYSSMYQKDCKFCKRQLPDISFMIRKSPSALLEYHISSGENNG